MEIFIKGLHLQNTYLQLPATLYKQVSLVEKHNPQVLLFNYALAANLGLDVQDTDMHLLAKAFSGSALLQNSIPIAQAYAGHQFGNFTMLGDGRALLLGEQLTPNNKLYDIQLKGSGITPYSRRGDGKATLSSMLREYIMSEAIYYLNIPTTRSLALVLTDDKVYRDSIQPGAILTRVAASHIRVGTFEYVSYFTNKATLEQFLSYTINRHYPHLNQAANKPLALLEAVMQQQINLITHWLRVGFIHGVMNTDNMSIAGETIDYGPCAFMNAYNPATVFSSIDTEGRYAFGNQPSIAHWNIGCLANALIPVIDNDKEAAIAKAQAVVNQFPALYRAAYFKTMLAKIGIEKDNEHNRNLLRELLQWMKEQEADYTNTFLYLTYRHDKSNALYNAEPFTTWYAQWQASIQQEPNAIKLMQQHNPCIIPRNHVVETLLQQATLTQNVTAIKEYLAVLQHPYQYNPLHSYYMQPPATATDKSYVTYCGT